MNNNYNKKITLKMRNPGKLYIKMSNDELAEHFSTGLVRISKEKCKNAYTLTDFRRGILEANSLRKDLDVNIHLTDLMMYALGQMEDKQQIIEDLQEIIKDYEHQLSNETKDKEIPTQEENQEIVETEDKN